MTKPTIQIRPAKGDDGEPLRVLLLSGEALPAEGALVPVDPHVRYLLRTGSVERVAEQPELAKPKTKPRSGSKED